MSGDIQKATCPHQKGKGFFRLWKLNYFCSIHMIVISDGFQQSVYWFALATVTKPRNPGDLHTNASSHTSGGYEFKIKVSAGLVPFED